MTSPVGGSPPPQPPTPVIVINVPSPTLFGIMRGIVNVIHAAHVHNAAHYNPGFLPPAQTWDRSFRPLGSPSSINLRNVLAELEELGPSVPSTVKPIERTSDGPRQVVPEQAADPKEAKGKDAGKADRPPGFEVPDMTDHTRRRDDRIKAQRQIAEMLDRIARLLKEATIAKEVIKQEIRESTAQFQEARRAAANEALAQLETKGREQPLTDPVEASPLAFEDDIHHIDLIIETTAPDGHVEQISVERGEIAELLHNLEGVLGPESMDALQQALAFEKEAPLADADNPQSRSIMGDVDAVQSVGGDVLPVAEQGNASQQPLAREGIAAAAAESTAAAAAAAAVAAAPTAAEGAAMASFMPFMPPPTVKPEKAAGDDILRVEGVEGEGGRFDAENKEARESEKAPLENAVGAKVSRKTVRQREVQDVADTATKDTRGKKSGSVQRGDEDKIIPVHGKFTVEQLRNIRRRRGKGEGGGGGPSSDTHRLIDVLYMILCAAVCGSQTIFDITSFIESKEKLFTTILGLRNGLPSSKLIGKLITGFNPNRIGDMLNLWIREAQGAPARSGLATVLVTETFEGIVFSQERSGIPSTAALILPQLLQFFELRGVVMMLSNGSASKGAIASIVRSGAHYIYDCGDEPIPGEEELLPLFEEAMADPKAKGRVQFTESYVEGQEYLQLYEVEAEGVAENVRSVSQILTEVVTPEGKEEAVQYFTSSLPKQSVWLFELLRTQRPVEGKAEWYVNMSMRGKHADESSFAAREFLALIRRYAIDMLLRDQTYQAPLSAKQQRATQEADYMMKLLRLS